jgi:hypothetical protein
MARGSSILFLAIKVFAIALLCLVAVALAFELYLRQAGFLKAQPANYPCVTGDPVLNHVFQENCEGIAPAEALKTAKDVTYKTNSLGFRGREPGSKPRRMVVIGDSYTEGFGLEEYETFSARLEESLESLGAKDIEVLNGGTLGFSPALYGKYFDRYFSGLSPTFVLLNLDFTDFVDDIYYLQIADYDESGRPIAFPGRDTFPSWLLPYVYSNSSALLRFLHQEWNQAHLIRMRHQNWPKMDKLVSQSPELIPPEELESSALASCKKPLEMTAKLILELKDKVEAAGAGFGIHMYPSGYMVKAYEAGPQNISYVQKWDQYTRKDYSWACSTNPEFVPVVRAFAERHGIAFFDSFPFVMSHPEKEALHFDRDSHWTARGVEEITRELAAPVLRALQSSGRRGQ